MTDAPIPELRPDAAHARLAALRVVDVREPHEFEGPLGRVPGSTCVPRSRLAQTAFDPAEAWLVVCRSGRRSLAACEALRARGVANVANLAGGMIAWNQSGLPIERTPLHDGASILRSLVAWLAQVGGEPVEVARGRVGAWLGELGEPFERISPEGVELVLRRVEQTLRARGAPDDLDLTVAAYRHDLSRR
ncbi:MAG: rhodanese-like domain-containing protein [Myxococcota bacterium]